MEVIKKYWLLIIFTGVIVILVLFRSFGSYHFKADATLYAKPSLNKSVFITEKQLVTITGEILFLSFGKNTGLINNQTGTTLSVSVDSVLNKRNLKKILNHRGPVLLISADKAVSARIWMLLSQMGRTDLFILSEDPENEIFKYKFNPDTLSRTELQSIK
jgi:hypothetical protein